jgi:hypothetical protein
VLTEFHRGTTSSQSPVPGEPDTLADVDGGTVKVEFQHFRAGIILQHKPALARIDPPDIACQEKGITALRLMSTRRAQLSDICQEGE